MRQYATKGGNMVTFEQIKKANESIKTTDIKGKDYAEVNQRIKAFRMVYPNGSITTDIIALENGIVTIKAMIANEEGAIIATGYAQEKESSSYINKTSYIENCETSAVGRALGFCGFGIDTSVASYEEVANAIHNQEMAQAPTPAPKAQPKLVITALDATLMKEAEDLGIELEKVATYLKKPVNLINNTDLQRCIDQKRKALGGAK
jgi:hypothetical protein